MRRVYGLISVSGLFAGMASASAQTEPAPQPPPPTLPGITVTATKMDEERSSILPSLGATKYDFSRTAIQNTPQGENAPLNQVLLRAPGVVQDGFGQIHVRGDHGSLQYRLDGVQLPEGLALFSQILSPRFANSLSLLTGALPAQYGLRTAGVVDIGVKSGTTNPGAELSFMGGSYNWVQPSAQYGGRSGNIDYYAVGQYLSNSIGIENPFSAWTPIHDQTSQWYGLAKVTGIVDENTRLSFIGGGVNASYQIPNNINQVPNFTVFGNSTWDSSILDQRQWESTYFGIASLQKTYQDFNMQLSGFARYSQLNYQPDAIGDLLYNGVAPWAQRTSFATGVQGDASWKVAPRHTLRGGFLVQRERVTSFAQANTLPFVPGSVDPDRSGCRPEPVLGDQPVGLTDSCRSHRLDLQRLPAGRMEGAADADRECRFALRCHHQPPQRVPVQPARQRRLGAHAGNQPARRICPLLRSRPVEPGLRRLARGARRHGCRPRGHDQRSRCAPNAPTTSTSA